MDWFFTIWLAVCAAGILICIRSFYCNAITFKERELLIDVIFAQADWDFLKHEFDRVTYGDHYRSRMLWRDAWSLYSTRVQYLVRLRLGSQVAITA